jgi:hypothetical protein
VAQLCTGFGLPLPETYRTSVTGDDAG